MSATQIAVYTGSFDPPTNGHLDILGRASALFGEVIIGLGLPPDPKSAVFGGRTAGAAAGRVRISTTFGSKRSTHSRRSSPGSGARVLVRGIRNGTDFESELQMAQANSDLAPEIDTVFLPTRAMTGYLSASRVRESASFGGDVSGYAPPIVCEALAAKFPD